MTAPGQQQQQQQSAQDRRRAAAAAMAAVMIAAAKVPLTVELRALAAIRMSAGVTQRGQDVATRLITAAWAKVNPYDDSSVEAFAEQAGRIIVATQRSVASATTAAQVSILRAAGVDVPTISPAIPDDVRGATVHFDADGPQVVAKPKVTVTYQGVDDSKVRQTVTAEDAHPSQLFGRAARVYRFSVSQGADRSTANDAAVQRIGSLVDGNLMLAQRLAEQQTLRQAQEHDSRVTGYRRVIHPELSKGGVCGLCVAASDRVYHVAELKPIHDRCKCTVAAVLDDSDVGYQLNKADFRMLYSDAGKLPGTSSTVGADLKVARYDIVHHAELGPVLTRVKGEKVPYYTGGATAVAA